MINNPSSLLESISQNILKETPSVDFHIHTNWTDGKNTVREMYDAACKRGIHYLLFSEHARRTSTDWFPTFANEVRSLPQEPCRAFVGVETRAIDFQGTLEIDDRILSHCDLVMGSVHRFPDNNGKALPFENISPLDALEIEFALSWSLLDNPHVHILGHPMGMSFKKFGQTLPKNRLIELIIKARDNKIAFEINQRYCPDALNLLALCKVNGALISLGSDAHSIQEVGNILDTLRERS